MITLPGRAFVPLHGGGGIGLYAAPEIEEHAELVCSLGNVLQGGPLEPGCRALLVAGHAITHCVLSTEVVLRDGEALLGSPPVPAGGLLGIRSVSKEEAAMLERLERAFEG